VSPRHTGPPDAPALSVVMPVHNGARYLSESIASVLAQTFTDFEFVILDDASTDDSAAILRGWAARDARIRIVPSGSRLGPAGSADRVVREARAPVCARMDADDVSHPDRLRAEWNVLRRHPEASLVGTLWEGIDAGGRRVRPRDRWRLLGSSRFAPFPHGSIMFRHAVFVRLGGYRPACTYWEDLDLYVRMAACGPIMVLPEALYRYRFHVDSTTGGRRRERVASALELMHRCMDRRGAGEDYTPLLTGEPASAGGSVDARTLFALGFPRLWAGQTPDILGDLRRIRPAAPCGAVLRAVVLAVWGELSPRSLRYLLRGLVRLRDRLAGWRISGGVAVEWRLPEPPARDPRRPQPGALVDPASGDRGRVRPSDDPAPQRQYRRTPTVAAHSATSTRSARSVSRCSDGLPPRSRRYSR
jgi:GT2 family glycosyltransferase